MKRLMIGAALFALLASPLANAQPDKHDNSRVDASHDRDGRWHEPRGRHDNGRHRGWGEDRGDGTHWSRGEQMGYNDWRSARRVDYLSSHLRQPPRGYEWRRVDDRFILAAVATGVIVSVIPVNGR